MAETPMRVLVRWKVNAAYFEAPQAEREKLWQEMGQIDDKWTAAGAELIGSWTSGAYVDGFNYYDLYEVGKVDMVRQLRDDWFGAETRKYIEGESLIGWAPHWDPALR